MPIRGSWICFAIPVRRGSAGKFKESDDVGKSLSADRRKKARKKVNSGQGDKGDL